MKFIKLSLITSVVISSAFAGGDIAPVEPVVIAEESSKTTISGKLTGYYITNDSIDGMFGDTHQLGGAATLDVSHELFDGVKLNLGAVGFVNALNKSDQDDIFGNGSGYFENDFSGAFMNVANITATFSNTTFILGRQLLDTPMLGGFDWLLAPGAFEAYTIANSSIENLTLVGSYVRTWRQNNTGDEWINLTDIGEGNNWTLGATYDNKALNGNIWYYNVDANNYTQVYADAGYNFNIVSIAGQYAYTDYDDARNESTAFGAKISGSLGGFNLMVAYNNISDNETGFVGRDTLYTSSWNTFTSNVMGNSYKVEASSEFSELSASASYAYYEYDRTNDEGQEIDLILAYNITDAIDVNAIYSNTDYGIGEDTNAFEIYANYKF